MLRIFGKLYRGLDAVRRAIANVLFVLLLLFLFGGFWYGVKTPAIPSDAVLRIDLQGSLVMAPSALSGSRGLIAKAVGKEAEETAVGDVTDALYAAASDSRIRAVLLRTDGLAGAGPASVAEIGKAIKAFEKSGKPVIAWSDSYSQAQWAIASYADKVFVHPMGDVTIKGLEATGLYFGDTLKKIGVTVNVAKAGAYKSAPETYTENKPSSDSLEAQRYWMKDEWAQFSEEMEKARGLPAGTLAKWTENYIASLTAFKGNAAKAAESAGLVTGSMNFPDLLDQMTEKSCASEDCSGDFVTLQPYLSAADIPHSSGSAAIGVVTLEGEISDASVSSINGSAESLVPLIRQAQADRSVRALVVQINSPGGSAVASEKIREALLSFKKSGRPVVAYFGDTAASGGYWVSTAADKVVTNPMSITGSIGVFGIMPTFENAVEKLSVGVHSESVGGTGIRSTPFMPMTDAAKKAAELQVENTYRGFLERVSKARGITEEEADAVGQGRVWTGRQAFERKLADQLGTSDDAAELAAELAGIGKDYELRFYYPEAASSITDLLMTEIRSDAVPSWIKETVNFFVRAEKTAAEPQNVSRLIRAELPWKVSF